MLHNLLSVAALTCTCALLPVLFLPVCPSSAIFQDQLSFYVIMFVVASTCGGLALSLSLSIYLSIYLCIYLSIYLSLSDSRSLPLQPYVGYTFTSLASPISA